MTTDETREGCPMRDHESRAPSADAPASAPDQAIPDAAVRALLVRLADLTARAQEHLEQARETARRALALYEEARAEVERARVLQAGHEVGDHAAPEQPMAEGAVADDPGDP
jgi:hypothetical protein